MKKPFVLLTLSLICPSDGFIAPLTSHSFPLRSFNLTPPPTTVIRRNYAPELRPRHQSSLSAIPLNNPLLEVFNSIDIDDSGTICEDELKELLNSLGMVASHDEVSALFKTLDVDGSGSICFEEFTTWYEDTLETCLMDGPSSPSSIIDNIKTRRTGEAKLKAKGTRYERGEMSRP